MSKKSPDPVDKHVGQRLRMRRMMIGMSQEKLAEAVGLTFQQIQKYEKGVNRMGASRLLRFAEILNMPVQFFFEGARATTMPAKDEGGAMIDRFLSTAGAATMAKAFLVLDPAVRGEFVSLIGAVAGAGAKLKKAA